MGPHGRFKHLKRPRDVDIPKIIDIFLAAHIMHPVPRGNVDDEVHVGKVVG